MDFLELTDKTIVIFGAANRKSVAFQIAALVENCGARVVHVVRSDDRKRGLAKLLGRENGIFVCDVEHEEQIARVRDEIAAGHPRIDGLVHSIAFAPYSGGRRPFHETPKADFLRSIDISCYSLVALAGAFREQFDADGSVVTISISTTRMAAENYGYMAPVKAGARFGGRVPGQEL